MTTKQPKTYNYFMDDKFRNFYGTNFKPNPKMLTNFSKVGLKVNKQECYQPYARTDMVNDLIRLRATIKSIYPNADFEITSGYRADSKSGHGYGMGVDIHPTGTKNNGERFGWKDLNDIITTKFDDTFHPVCHNNIRPGNTTIIIKSPSDLDLLYNSSENYHMDVKYKKYYNAAPKDYNLLNKTENSKNNNIQNYTKNVYAQIHNPMGELKAIDHNTLQPLNNQNFRDGRPTSQSQSQTEQQPQNGQQSQLPSNEPKLLSPEELDNELKKLNFNGLKDFLAKADKALTPPAYADTIPANTTLSEGKAAPQPEQQPSQPVDLKAARQHARDIEAFEKAFQPPKVKLYKPPVPKLESEFPTKPQEYVSPIGKPMLPQKAIKSAQDAMNETSTPAKNQYYVDKLNSQPAQPSQIPQQDEPQYNASPEVQTAVYGKGIYGKVIGNSTTSEKPYYLENDTDVDLDKVFNSDISFNPTNSNSYSPKTFSVDEIKAMSNEEFLANENSIKQQMQNEIDNYNSFVNDDFLEVLMQIIFGRRVEEDVYGEIHYPKTSDREILRIPDVLP